MSHKLTIGFITYKDLTAKYLPFFLLSLKKQDFQDFKILVFDNSGDSNNNVKYIQKNYSELEIISQNKNLGFAGAYNLMIKRAFEVGSEYFLALNPDMILEPDAILKMLKIIDFDKNLASVAPKILKWNFNNDVDYLGGEKTNIIDSCGIKEISAIRFKDLGQGEIDKNQYVDSKILGPSGAAAMYRVSALEKVKEGQNYFDELMFMYEEDCDLAYRLKIAGFKTKFINNAIIYHDRTARSKGSGVFNIIKNRKNKNKNIRKWAFLNKHIMFIKYFKILSLKEKLEVFYFAFRMFIFACIFERFLLKEYITLIKIRKKIKKYI